MINPSDELNFGPLLVNSKRSKTFTIENKHEFFDFSFTISKSSSGPHISVPAVTLPVTDLKKMRKFVIHLYLFDVTEVQSHWL